jgi:hypothetical protein
LKVLASPRKVVQHEKIHDYANMGKKIPMA